MKYDVLMQLCMQEQKSLVVLWFAIRLQTCIHDNCSGSLLAFLTRNINYKESILQEHFALLFICSWLIFVGILFYFSVP